MISMGIISSRAGESVSVCHQVTVPGPNDKGFPSPILVSSLSLGFPWWIDYHNMIFTVIISRQLMVITSEITILLHLHQIPLFSLFKILDPKNSQQLIQDLSSTLADFQEETQVSLCLPSIAWMKPNYPTVILSTPEWSQNPSIPSDIFSTTGMKLQMRAGIWLGVLVSQWIPYFVLRSLIMAEIKQG